MDMKERTAAEQVNEQWEGRRDDFAVLAAAASGYEQDQAKLEALGVDPHGGEENVRESAQEAIYDYPLAIEVQKVLRIDLSTGGPGDWLEAKVSEGDIDSITYHFAPWFDHAEITLTGKDFDIALDFIHCLYPIDTI